MCTQFRSARLASAWILACVLSVGGTAAAQGQSPDGIWNSIEVEDLDQLRAAGTTPWIRPGRFRAVELEPVNLTALIDAAPPGRSAKADTASLIVTLPRPDGGFERFAVVETNLLHPDLAQWMSDQGWPIRTYSGASLDRPGYQVSLDWGGPAGFHAMVLAGEDTYFIDPYWRGDDRLYASYLKREYSTEGNAFQCEVHGEVSAIPREAVLQLAETGGDLRTYRIAVAATGEYTAYHGGTQLDGLAAVVTSMNRVSGIFSLEVSVDFQLVANNDAIIYTDPAGDPYPPEPNPIEYPWLLAMINKNQEVLDLVIGNDYDIGHVFTQIGADSVGIADNLEIVCESGVKAKALSGSISPAGDPFDVDYVAHEIGHQFGANHTFNGTLDYCNNDSNPDTAMEPGSGSTIMSYAGGCGDDDLQPHADPNFHVASLDEILEFVAGEGACSQNTPNVNPNAPTVMAPADVAIPKETPFELTALSGDDADGDALSYSWEQVDAGDEKPLSTGDDGVQPIFRVWPPTANPTRVFPRLSDVLDPPPPTDPPTGETLPVTDRTMNFRVTVRDNRPGGGRVGDDSMTVTSTTSSGPFLVISPNGGEMLEPGAETVTWDVANTTSAPVSAGSVDIFLSLDGGFSFPTTLAVATPNDGSQTLNLPPPCATTNDARVKVKGTDNVFFDVSDGSFTITPADSDNDGVSDFCDNCPTQPNGPDGGTCTGGTPTLFPTLCNSDSDCESGEFCSLNQEDFELEPDGVGDACDNCPVDYNPDQENSDGDRFGNVCDPTPFGGGHHCGKKKAC